MNKNDNIVMISKDIRVNEKHVRERLQDCGDIQIRRMRLGEERKVDCLMVYIEVATSNMMLEDSALGKMIGHFWEISPAQIQEFAEYNSLGIADVKKLTDMEQVFTGVLSGDAVFFMDGFDQAMKISSAGYPSMGVTEVEMEKVLRGSKEGFSDSVKTNSALIRKRLRDTRLKVVEFYIGERSHTLVQMVYMEDLVREEFLEQVKERLEAFRIDGILDSGMLEQLTEDSWFSPFPQYQTTERPDRASKEILNGKVVLLCDNSPSALVLPGVFNSFMESSEDWYNRFEMASFLRVLRYLAMAVATLLPGLYLAVIRFHTQILPANLILSFAQAREGVPFSSVVELVFLELSFELIREAGVRIPGALGNAIGIVGGLIIGQAAVEANLVSPVVVIIVALTALGSLAIPNEEFASAFRLLKYAFLFLGGFLGIFGIVLGLYLTMAHLAGLLSFGVPYLVPFVEKNSETETGGRILRQPFRKRKFRPLYARNAQKRRLRTRPWSRKG
jgi:spore germination protein